MDLQTPPQSGHRPNGFPFSAPGTDPGMHNGYPVTGRKRNWLLIILAVVLVSPLVLVMGAVFLIAVVAAIGGAARDQTSASPLQNVAPVSVGADHNGSDLNVNVNL